MWTHEPWRDVRGLVHGFLGRTESDGAGGWDERIAAALGIDARVATPRQVHGARVLTVDDPPGAGEADALVTSAIGVLVGVVTADCTPVLLRAPGTPAVAALHAGWRGVAAGIVEAGVARLCEVARIAAPDVEAAIGPAIGPCCYQVGPDVRDAFERRLGRAADSVFTPDAGDRLRLDLRAGVRLALERAGVTASSVVGPCTRCTPALHSYRRDGARAGRQLSFIGRT